MNTQLSRIWAALLAGWLAIAACSGLVVAPRQPTAGGPSQEALVQTGVASTLTALPSATPSPTSAATASPPATASACQPTVTAKVNANVRSGPSTRYKIVGSLSEGATAHVVATDESATWWYIEYGKRHGWISSTVTTSTCIPNNLTVITF